MRGRRIDDLDVGLGLRSEADSTLPPEGVCKGELPASQDLRARFIATERKRPFCAIAYDDESQAATKPLDRPDGCQARTSDTNGGERATARHDHELSTHLGADGPFSHEWVCGRCPVIARMSGVAQAYRPRPAGHGRLDDQTSS